MVVVLVVEVKEAKGQSSESLALLKNRTEG
jgi:hypothetical protein